MKELYSQIDDQKRYSASAKIRGCTEDFKSGVWGYYGEFTEADPAEEPHRSSAENGNEPKSEKDELFFGLC